MCTITCEARSLPCVKYHPAGMPWRLDALDALETDLAEHGLDTSGIWAPKIRGVVVERVGRIEYGGRARIIYGVDVRLQNKLLSANRRHIAG